MQTSVLLSPHSALINCATDKWNWRLHSRPCTPLLLLRGAGADAIGCRVHHSLAHHLLALACLGCAHSWGSSLRCGPPDCKCSTCVDHPGAVHQPLLSPQ